MKLQLDGHKLLYHLEELCNWSKGKEFYPLYVELSPASICNHRCVHCYIRYLGFNNELLNKDIMIKLVHDLGRIGVKALCIAGTGEPFLNKATPEVIVKAKKSGLDVACATNGILFTRAIAKKALKHLTWIRFSMLGGSAATYEKLQGAKRGDWEKLLENIKHSVAVKRSGKLGVTIGVVFFLFKDNGHEVARVAGAMKEIGVDYLVIKPVGDYDKNKYVAEKHLKDLFSGNLKEAETLDDEGFNVQVRWDMFEEWGNKPYKKCLSLPFMTVIDANGSVYACGGYWQDKRYSYGNLYKQPFKMIWDSKKRKKIMKTMEEKINFKECYNCCRNHTMNMFLWSLRQKPAHVNFI